MKRLISAILIALTMAVATPKLAEAQECLPFDWQVFTPEYMSMMMWQILNFNPTLFAEADAAGVLNDPYVFWMWYLGNVCV